MFFKKSNSGRVLVVNVPYGAFDDFARQCFELKIHIERFVPYYGSDFNDIYFAVTFSLPLSDEKLVLLRLSVE
jgi:hypothetical protein